jgi:hypothetical protein
VGVTIYHPGIGNLKLLLWDFRLDFIIELTVYHPGVWSFKSPGAVSVVAGF